MRRRVRAVPTMSPSLEKTMATGREPTRERYNHKTYVDVDIMFWLDKLWLITEQTGVCVCHRFHPSRLKHNPAVYKRKQRAVFQKFSVLAAWTPETNAATVLSFEMKMYTSSFKINSGSPLHLRAVVPGWAARQSAVYSRNEEMHANKPSRATRRASPSPLTLEFSFTRGQAG